MNWKYLLLLIPAFFILIGVQYQLDHFVRAPRDISNLEKLVQNGIEIQAQYEKEYEEIAIGALTILYKRGYHFEVNDQKYEGIHNTNEYPGGNEKTWQNKAPFGLEEYF